MLNTPPTNSKPVKLAVKNPAIPIWVSKNKNITTLSNLQKSEKGKVLYDYLSALPKETQEQIEIVSHERPTSKNLHSLGLA
jgi:hypothetical protein